MNSKQKPSSFRSRSFLLFVTFVFTFATIAGSFIPIAEVSAVPTSEEYCKSIDEIDTSVELNACKDGIRGADCSDYLIVADASTEKICSDAAAEMAAEGISDTPAPTTSTTDALVYNNVILRACQTYQNDAAATLACVYGGLGENNEGEPSEVNDCVTKYKSSNRNQNACITGATAGQRYLATQETEDEEDDSSFNTNLTSFQDMLDQSSSLSEYTDTLHERGQDSAVDVSEEPDDTYGSYVNGAGQQQKINVFPCTGGEATAAAGSTGSIAGGSIGGSSGGSSGAQAKDKDAIASLFDGSSSGGSGSTSNILSQITQLLGGASSDEESEREDLIDQLSNDDLSESEQDDLIDQLLNTSSSSQDKIDNTSFGGGGCPAVIWFNGGGWHSNDGTAYCLATGSSQKNCQAGKDGGGDTGIGDKGAPAGGGANQRGYAVLEVTYRLGSSGVYYMFEDVMRGIQHIVNNAGMYGVDASKLVIGGDSAGGSLSIRAAASGKTGAKAAIGWSAPTNAFTALFRSYKSFLIGMDHSTCVPTDLAGAANATDLLSGGSGDVAQYGQGLSSNDFTNLGITQGNSGIGFDSSSIGSAGGLGSITQVLTAAQYAVETSQNVATISSQLQDGDIQSISGSVVNLSAKKLTECIDNMMVMSPALFASPETPPSVLAGFDTDDVVGPEQATGMRDKLRALGIRSESIVIPGDPNAGNNALGTSDNHLGYDPRFVCQTFNFVDEIVQPELAADPIDCATGKRPSEVSKAEEASADANSPGGDQSNPGGDQSSPAEQADCTNPKSGCSPQQMAHCDNNEPGYFRSTINGEERCGWSERKECIDRGGEWIADSYCRPGQRMACETNGGTWIHQTSKCDEKPDDCNSGFVWYEAFQSCAYTTIVNDYALAVGSDRTACGSGENPPRFLVTDIDESSGENNTVYCGVGGRM